MLSDYELRALLGTLRYRKGAKDTLKSEAVVREFLRTKCTKTTASNMGVSTEVVWNTVSRYRLVAKHLFERTDEER